jgi:hypothetical protein
MKVEVRVKEKDKMRVRVTLFSHDALLRITSRKGKDKGGKGGQGAGKGRYLQTADRLIDRLRER